MDADGFRILHRDLLDDLPDELIVELCVALAAFDQAVPHLLALGNLFFQTDFFLLGLYARSDVGIHYEGWTPAEMNALWNGYGITDADALAEIYQAIRQAVNAVEANITQDIQDNIEKMAVPKELEHADET